MKDPEYDLINQAYIRLEYRSKQCLEEIDKKCEADQVFLGEELLKYFTSDEVCILQEERVLQNGEELMITKTCKIVGAIKVLKGGRLIFSDAEVEIHAQVHVEGGCLEIKDSKFKSSKSMCGYMFVIMDTTVSIERSSFDGNDTTGIWCHINGELFIENCTFTNTAKRSCLTLWECSARIKVSRFTACRSEKSSGGAIYTNSNLEVLESCFENCSAYKGAAIYRFAAVIPWVGKSKGQIAKGRHYHKEESKMFELFGRKIDFIPRPKSFKRIAYPIILRHNQFLNCNAYKSGIVCAYKLHVVINEENTFSGCEGQNIYYYE